jgi:hypothetical protein
MGKKPRKTPSLKKGLSGYYNHSLQDRVGLNFLKKSQAYKMK